MIHAQKIACHCLPLCNVSKDQSIHRVYKTRQVLKVQSLLSPKITWIFPPDCENSIFTSKSSGHGRHCTLIWSPYQGYTDWYQSEIILPIIHVILVSTVVCEEIWCCFDRCGTRVGQSIHRTVFCSAVSCQEQAQSLVKFWMMWCLSWQHAWIQMLMQKWDYSMFNYLCDTCLFHWWSCTCPSMLVSSLLWCDCCWMLLHLLNLNSIFLLLLAILLQMWLFPT